MDKTEIAFILQDMYRDGMEGVLDSDVDLVGLKALASGYGFAGPNNLAVRLYNNVGFYTGSSDVSVKNKHMLRLLILSDEHRVVSGKLNLKRFCPKSYGFTQYLLLNLYVTEKIFGDYYKQRIK